MSSSESSSVGQAGLLVLVGTVFGMFSDFLLRVLLSNTLGSSEFGSIFLVISILNLVSIPCLLGLNQGIVKFAAANKSDPRNVYITFSIIVILSISISVSILLSYLSSDMTYLFFGYRDLLLVYILSALLPVYALYKLLLSALRGLMATNYHVLISNIIHPFLKMIFAVSIAWYIGSVISVLVAIWFAFLISITIGIVLLLNSGWRPALSSQVEYRSLIYFSSPLMISSSIYIMLKNIDKALIGGYITTAAVGQYEVAITIAALLGIFQSSFSFLFYPKVSELLSKGREAEVPAMYKQITKWIILLTLPFYVFLLIRPEGIIALFGSRYIVDDVFLPLAVIATGYFLDAILGPNGQTLLGFGKSKSVLIYNLIAVVLNIILNILLIPVYGLIGAALASLFGYTLMNLLKSIDLWINHHIKSFHFSSIIACLGVVPISLVLFLLVPKLEIVAYELTVGVLSSALSVLFGILILYLGGYITPADREMLLDIVDNIKILVE